MNNRSRYASSSVTPTIVNESSPLQGTKLEWGQYVDQLEAVGVSTNRWIDYLRRRGFITPSMAGAELMRLVRSYGYCTTVSGGVEKLRKESGLSAIDKKHVRAVWSLVVTMRSRYDSKTGAEKVVAAPAPAPAPAPVAPAPVAPAPAPVAAPAAPALPSVEGQCLTVDRQALQQVLDLLKDGELKQGIVALETLLS